MSTPIQTPPPARPRPELTDRSLYPRWYEISTRFGDMDPAKHVNNVAIAQLYEEGRVRFHRERAGNDPIAVVVAQIAIHYLGEVHYPAPVQIGTGAAHVGRSSFTTSQALFQGGICVGLAQTTAVVVDGDGAATPLPDWFRAYLEQSRIGAPVSA
ncbi:MULTISPECIES: acyl-CoA thioesterase [Aeromicrobium]|uniref:acyl-CoA thioesterase n=1 Tax=Aeromicrobium TaxID=2040 RepID=UPI00188E6F86|nr:MULTISPECIES: thioesterase family protein [Aeromicrobium]